MLEALRKHVATRKSHGHGRAPDWNVEPEISTNESGDLTAMEASDQQIEGLADTAKPDEDILALGLPTRTYNVLRRAGITSVSKLRSLCQDDVLGIRGLSIRGLEDIQKVLGPLPQAPIYRRLSYNRSTVGTRIVEPSLLAQLEA